jgi:succinyl-CoA synthetase beta subunit
MNIHEYQAKAILGSYGIPVPRGRTAASVRQAEGAAKKLGFPCVVKAQIHSGGRGKAGGVRAVQNLPELRNAVRGLLGNRLATVQTGPEGLPVSIVLIEEALETGREFYFSITLDRAVSRYCLLVSPAGGMNIEEVTKTRPGDIHTLHVDPFTGLRSYHARGLALKLGLKGVQADAFVKLAGNLWKLFLEKDCSLVEVNPLVVTGAGSLVSMDCKINFDDNALFRHPEYEDMADLAQMDPLEVKARKFDIAYIKLAGNIGCMVNGAGLAMATLDVLKEYGGEPANFLDVGGSANREKVAEAFRIILNDGSAKGVFVNIFGGIMRCDIIAQGILDAAGANCSLPIVVRMDGSRLEEGKRLLNQSSLDIVSADTLAEGAEMIVQRIRNAGAR